MESDDEDYMQDSDVDYGAYESDEDYAFELSAGEEEPSSRLPQANYTILSEEDILERQREAVDNVVAVLSLPREDAGVLLRHFKWSVSRVNDEWFADEEGVRSAVGLVHPAEKRIAKDKKLTCGICFDDFSREEMKAARCCHFFCVECWKGYIHTAVVDGPGCLTLRCPQDKCNAAVGEEMVLSLVSPEDEVKYHRYLLRSYVEDNRKAKWCPAPNCEYAVELVPGAASYDVTCKCKHQFCSECLEEGHRPVNCETVHKWIMKNTAESENMNWILANSKPCPKCKRPIEKNQGCMHMSCTPPCKFEFCWLCLGAWSEHGERTGGFYACNRYETAKQEGVYDEAERRREMARNSLERYTHYYERWASNEQSRGKALSDLKEWAAEKAEGLSERQSLPTTQLKFITEAMEQIVECRRVLKWTYAYGYYLPEEERAKRQFFEYLQGDAEANLERLHQCAEKDLKQFSDPEPGTPTTLSFNEFRTKLAGLTSVTRSYFEKIVQALENNLADVDSSKAPAVNEASSSKSSSKGGKNSKGSKSGGANTRSSGRNIGEGSNRRGGASGSGGDEAYWSCERCTFANTGTAVCAMCNTARGQ